MKVSMLFSALGAVALTSATPVPAKRADISSASVTFYKDMNFGGSYYNEIPDANKCYSMKKGFNDGVSAIRIQKIGGINSPYNPFCIFNVDSGCKGAGYQLGTPGDGNLVSSGFNDKISSYWCWSG